MVDVDFWYLRLRRRAELVLCKMEDFRTRVKVIKYLSALRKSALSHTDFNK